MRVFSVPVSVPFLRTVIAALVDGRLVDGFEARKDPLNLARATLYLPTRRAGRMAREIFLDELRTDAAILPRIVALGDIDEDELAFSEGSEQFGGIAPLDIPPRLGELERRLTLARLVAAWAKSPVSAPLVVGGPASTLALAGDLARLMDDMATRGVDWAALDRLVPDQLDKYWQHSLEFLRIARKAWPDHLQEIGRIEPAARRDLLIDAEAARLTAHHEGPVIAAGSTGSMPATAKFLHVVANLKQGAVVLPGLDTDLDDEAWQTRKANSPHRHHRTTRNMRCRDCWIGSASSAETSRYWARRHHMGATCWFPRRCGHRPRPKNGMTGWSSPRYQKRFRAA